MASYEVGHPTFRVSMSWDLRQSHNHENHSDVVTSWFSLWCSFHGGANHNLSAPKFSMFRTLVDPSPWWKKYVRTGVEPGHRKNSHVKWEQQFLVLFFYLWSLNIIKWIWVWVNTYRYIFSGMNIHKSQLWLGVHGTVPGFWPIPIFFSACWNLLPGQPPSERWTQYNSAKTMVCAALAGAAQSSWNDGNGIGMYRCSISMHIP